MPHTHSEYLDSSLTLSIVFSVILIGFLLLAFFTFGNHKHGFCEPLNMYNSDAAKKNPTHFCGEGTRDENEYTDYEKPRQYSKIAMDYHKEQIQNEYDSFDGGVKLEQIRKQYDPEKPSEKKSKSKT